MKAEKAKVAVIGGTGLEDIFKATKQLEVETPYGEPSRISLGSVNGQRIVFLQRHNAKHTIPPHMLNYKANIHALHQVGTVRILATNAVGSISQGLKPGDLVAPHDFIDFTKKRSQTFYDEAPVTHIDLSQPYCPQIRGLLVEASRRIGIDVLNKAVLVCTEGPRFETPAEIEMFRRLGCDIVGMTSSPEAALARELQMCYEPLCYVSNMAVGMQKQLIPTAFSAVSSNILPTVKELLVETIRILPEDRDCPCGKALKYARAGF